MHRIDYMRLTNDIRLKSTIAISWTYCGFKEK